MQYNFDEPWDGPNNRKLIDKMPPVYGYPSLGGTGQSQPRTSSLPAGDHAWQG